MELPPDIYRVQATVVRGGVYSEVSDIWLGVLTGPERWGIFSMVRDLLYCGSPSLALTPEPQHMICRYVPNKVCLRRVLSAYQPYQQKYNRLQTDAIGCVQVMYLQLGRI